MTILEQIEERLRRLPPQQQSEALQFIESLYRQAGLANAVKPRSLKDHPAFGSWRRRKVDGVKYQRDLRAEWGA